MQYKLWYIYVLELEDNHWYVGITVDLSHRFTSHFTGVGAKWTMLHKPLRVYDIKELGYISDTDAAEKESYATYLYVAKYGIQNVRGGFFCQTKLTDRYWSKVSKKFNKDYKGNGISIHHPAGMPMKKRKARSSTALARAQLDKNARLLGVDC